MSYNAAGTFNINTGGQPVVDGTTITASVFNALTADLATGLSTAICKDGQTTITANIPMAGYKFTGLGLGSSTTDSARMDNATIQNVCECRISSAAVTSGGVISVADNATFIYCGPYKGNKIALYNGTQWVLRSFATAIGGAIAVPATTNTNYDFFIYDNAGSLAFELLAWSNDTTRATALVLQDGVLCKTGALGRRYIGTVRTGSVSGRSGIPTPTGLSGTTTTASRRGWQRLKPPRGLTPPTLSGRRTRTRRTSLIS